MGRVRLRKPPTIPNLRAHTEMSPVAVKIDHAAGQGCPPLFHTDYCSFGSTGYRRTVSRQQKPLQPCSRVGLCQFLKAPGKHTPLRTAVRVSKGN
jgi:hypothetical protein